MDESTRIVWGHQLNMKKDCKYRKMLAQERNNAKYVHNRRVRKRFTKKITMQICPRCTRKCFTKKKSKCSYVHESARSGGSRVRHAIYKKCKYMQCYPKFAKSRLIQARRVLRTLTVNDATRRAALLSRLAIRVNATRGCTTFSKSRVVS